MYGSGDLAVDAALVNGSSSESESARNFAESMAAVTLPAAPCL